MPPLTADALLAGRVQLAQPADGYRVALDPVLLAAAVTAAPGQTILDAGCGTGAAMLCLMERVPATLPLGIERQAEVAAIARMNLVANGRAGTAEVVEGDLGSPPPELQRATFDHVMTNPPFLPAGRGTVSPAAGREAAHVETLALTAWVEACLKRLRSKGWLTLIQRADRLDELCAALAGKAGDLSILPIWPRVDSPSARRVLLRARKGSLGPARLLRGLVLHERNGDYTAEASAVLRDGAGLTWD